MQLIPTQSKATICAWSINYSETYLLPIFEKQFPGDKRPAKAITAARRWLASEVKLPEAKRAILACHTAAREAEAVKGANAAIAAARAIGQAAGTIHAPGHSLAIAFYGTAAVAYEKLGLDASQADYAREAEAECGRMEKALRNAAVAHEANPAKINWAC
jgi:hypothetical protein